MAWTPPHPPLNNLASRVAYWRAILEVPPDELSAATLKTMAAHRLLELHAISAADAQPYLDGYAGAGHH